MQHRQCGRRLSPARAPAPGGQRRHAPAPGCPDAGGGGDGGVEEDRISNLPEDLLLAVLARVGCARQAAHSSVLARPWRGLWTRLPELVLRRVSFDSIEGLLARFTSSKLDRLDILGEEDVTGDEVASLLRSAQRLAPDDLSIDLYGSVKENEVIDLPCFDRTTRLMLKAPELNLASPRAGEFKALERLELGASSIDMGNLLAMCPSLRSLKLDCSYSVSDVVTVHSASLENLDVVSIDDERMWEIFRIDIRAPVLKVASFTIFMAPELNVSFLAPMVEEIYFDCQCENGNVGLPCMRLDKMSYSFSHGIQKLVLFMYWEDWVVEDAHWSFEQQLAQLPLFSQLSDLKLELQTEGHAFAPVVLHLLKIRPVKVLRVVSADGREVGRQCPLNCHCDDLLHSNWRNENICLTDLEEVELDSFDGESSEVDFLKVIFRCAPALKSVKVGVFAEGLEKICSICEQYPHVKCDVYRHHH